MVTAAALVATFELTATCITIGDGTNRIDVPPPLVVATAAAFHPGVDQIRHMSISCRFL